MNPNHESPFTQDTYQTGYTNPPKNRGGILALVLILVIFFCGVSTVLGIFEVPLPDPLKAIDQDVTPLSFSGVQSEASSEAVPFALGFSGQEVPELWCLYQDLPQGIYITNVDTQSDAALKGVLPGDILMCVNGQSVTDPQQLQAILEKQQDQSAQVILYRSGSEIELTLAPVVD